MFSAVSHIPKFEDALTASAGDPALLGGDVTSFVGDVDFSRR
jgi:hypothetical protein